MGRKPGGARKPKPGAASRAPPGDRTKRDPSACGLCRSLGAHAYWGSNCPDPHGPEGVARLEDLGDELKRCPDCGTRYRVEFECEQAADHFMPDMNWRLTRL